jgi:anti-anti-sigma regulatory factor
MAEREREAWTAGGGPTATRVGRALVVTLPRELDTAALAVLRGRVLERLRGDGVRAVVFEASGLELLDAEEFAALAATARAAAWLGVRPVLVGLTPGVVRYLVDTGADTSGFEPFGTLDDALAALAERGAEPAAEGDARDDEAPSEAASAARATADGGAP